MCLAGIAFSIKAMFGQINHHIARSLCGGLLVTRSALLLLLHSADLIIAAFLLGVLSYGWKSTQKTV